MSAPMAAAQPSRNLQFSKTKMCRFELLGMCAKGTQCPFAHSTGELRPLPDLRCTKLCRELLQSGACSNRNCSYAHSREELRKPSHEELRAATDKATASHRARRSRAERGEANLGQPGGRPAARAPGPAADPAYVPLRPGSLALGSAASPWPEGGEGFFWGAAEAAAPELLRAAGSSSGLGGAAAPALALAAPRPTQQEGLGGQPSAEAEEEQEWEEVRVTSALAAASSAATAGLEGARMPGEWAAWGGYGGCWGAWGGFGVGIQEAAFGDALPKGSSVYVQQQDDTWRIGSLLRASAADAQQPQPMRAVRTSESTLCTLGDASP
mmetsp:Transcript_104933/g.326183  ORF Transcript_104933/g.326183 Transcript_104933/m.326183 type:complete len:325 (+) Transcript_104933:51-1025(+)